jgi:hypothetical protein
MSTLAHAYPEVRRRLEAWCGFSVLHDAMRTHDDLRVYVAGGVVRDVLLGLSSASKDWDFFLAGLSVHETSNLFRRHGRLAETPYGAPRWYPKADESQYADLIPIVDFIPGLWRCEDIVDVLNQFDFTANAVAFDLRTGEAFDPQNGARDTVRRTMKMVRFDYPNGPYIAGATLDRNVVLWFRIVHYASTLNLQVEPLTRDWLLTRGDLQIHAEAFARQFFRPDLRAWEALSG